MSAVQQPSPDLCFFESVIRHDWTQEQARALFDLPLNDLLHHAHTLHRQYFNPNEVQLSTLLNIKSGGCPEDCGYCPQSVRFDTQVEATPLMEVETVLASAKAAKENGASRFCMGAAWRSPKERDFSKVLEMVEAVKSLGMESCATLGMLSREQALRLKDAGLDYYNHNLDTSPDYYKSIISTREYEDRLNTLSHVRDAGLNVCCGGIIGMGEDVEDRAGLLITLANMEKHPESVPVNMLVRVEGTPLENAAPVIPLEIVRTIAVARVMMPASWLRLSAGRNDMSEELQALCFYAGANSVFFGEKLLTTDNPQQERDLDLFRRLGLSLKP
jgi:biotin synthase